MTSATGKQTESQTTLSKADLEELLRREAKPGSAVLIVFLDTDQSRVRGRAASVFTSMANIGAFLRW